MGFLIHDTKDGQPGPWEYLEASAIGACKVGMALTQSSGNLALASGTTAPTYISMTERDTACTAGDLIPVVRVQKDTVYETTLAASGASLKVGDRVTLHTDGMQVTATTTSGVAEIVEILGTAIGGKVRVRF